MNTPRAPRALTLRPAQLLEAPYMAQLSRDLIERGLAWRYTPARMAALVHDPDNVALVACDGPHIQGFAVMRFADVQAHLMLLCVQPAVQRCGTGQRLCDWLLASARVAGIQSVQLELRADNPGAERFYRRLGFSASHTVPAYYDGRIAARQMTLQLGATTPACTPPAFPAGPEPGRAD